MNNLRAATRGVLQSVEEVTGRPIQFMRDDSLKVMATLQMARQGASFHVLRYRPSDSPLDYLVVQQAAFILRLYENDPAQRFDFVPSDTAGGLMESLIPAGRPLAGADAKALPEFAKFTAQWALMNVRSLPVGMRVDAWINATLPDLHDLQRASLSAQQQENVQVLSYRLGGLSAPRLLLGMLAAYAMFVDRLYGTQGYAVPYRAGGLQDHGAELLQAWDAIDAGATHDIELIDRWAALSGLAGQYNWIPFRP